MKGKYEALSFQSGKYNIVKMFKREHDAITFANQHAEITLRTVGDEGETLVWNEHKQTWEREDKRGA